MIGETPRHIKALVLNPEQAIQEIVLAPKQDQDDIDHFDRGIAPDGICFPHGVIQSG